jgi:hypothetical protein
VKQWGSLSGVTMDLIDTKHSLLATFGLILLI